MDIDERVLNILKNSITQNFNDSINNVLLLIRKSYLAEEELLVLRAFINAYLTIHNFKLNNSGNIPNDIAMQIEYYLNITNPIINECYIEPVTKGKLLILNIIDSSLKNDMASQQKSNTRSLMKNGIRYQEFPNVENDYGRISGFANNIFIIIGVIVFGIILAILIK